VRSSDPGGDTPLAKAEASARWVIVGILEAAAIIGRQVEWY